MNRILIISALLLLTCITSAQETGKIVTDQKSGKQMILGFTEREAFKDTSFSWWYEPEYNDYEVSMEDLTGVSDSIKNYDILMVMGTWCSDSRQQVPRLLKILDTLGMSQGRIKILAVGRDKKALADETEGLKIELVPTIIFYKDKTEQGRITETPAETLEKDLANIVFHRPLKEKAAEEENK